MLLCRAGWSPPPTDSEHAEDPVRAGLECRSVVVVLEARQIEPAPCARDAFPSHPRCVSGKRPLLNVPLSDGTLPRPGEGSGMGLKRPRAKRKRAGCHRTIAGFIATRWSRNVYPGTRTGVRSRNVMPPTMGPHSLPIASRGDLTWLPRQARRDDWGRARCSLQAWSSATSTSVAARPTAPGRRPASARRDGGASGRATAGRSCPCR